MRTALFFLVSAAACGGWSRGDTLGELAFITSASLDEGQTQTITAHCAETNPIIGPCGDRVTVGSFFFGAEVMHGLVSIALPPAARRWWQGLTIGGELATVWKNHGDGISF